MQFKTPNDLSSKRFAAIGVSKNQVVWFDWQTNSYIRALLDGRVMEVIPPDEPFSSACQLVLQFRMESEHDEVFEQKSVKAEILEKFILPILEYRRGVLEAEHEKQLAEAAATVEVKQAFQKQFEQTGFDFSFLETFR